MTSAPCNSNFPDLSEQSDDAPGCRFEFGSSGSVQYAGARTTVNDSAQNGDAHRQLRALAALTELLSRVGASMTRAAACQALADGLQSYLNCGEVVVGWCKEGSESCQVEAISQINGFSRDSTEVRMAQAVLQESVARSDLTVWPAADVGDRYGLKAHEQYVSMRRFSEVVACPMRDESGQVRAVCLVADYGKTLNRDQVSEFLTAASTPVATSLQLVTRAEAGRFVAWSRTLLAGLRGHRGLALLSALVLTIGIMFVPVPFRVKCDFQLEPVTRRFVAAPFDGPLQESFVKPGDLVTKDQLLARMDGREIRWELAGLQAELFRATKERAGHVASHAAGDAEMARHEVDRLRYREQLLNSRDQHLEICSPVDGIIVSGDLQASKGMPLEIGEVLFEVSPLSEMDVELAIPEDEMPFVKRGMHVDLVLDAFPMERFRSRIEQVHPRAEIVENENVFVAEVPLDNPHQRLLPGMRGRARIAAGKARIGWIIFRRPLATMREWLGW